MRETEAKRKTDRQSGRDRRLLQAKRHTDTSKDKDIIKMYTDKLIRRKHDKKKKGVQN